MPKSYQKVKIRKGPDFFLRGRIFFLRGRIFPLDRWPESYAKSWQHCDSVITGAGGVHLRQIEEGEDVSGLAGQ